VFEFLEPLDDENLRKMPNSGRTVRAARQEASRRLRLSGAQFRGRINHGHGSPQASDRLVWVRRE
jgi:hypothetical protein